MVTEDATEHGLNRKIQVLALPVNFRWPVALDISVEQIVTSFKHIDCDTTGV